MVSGCTPPSTCAGLGGTHKVQQGGVALTTPTSAVRIAWPRGTDRAPWAPWGEEMCPTARPPPPSGCSQPALCLPPPTPDPWHPSPGPGEHGCRGCRPPAGPARTWLMPRVRSQCRDGFHVLISRSRQSIRDLGGGGGRRRQRDPWGLALHTAFVSLGGRDKLGGLEQQKCILSQSGGQQCK